MCGCTCKIHELNMVRSFATYVTKMEESNFSCNDSIGYVPMNVLGWWVVLG